MFKKTETLNVNSKQITRSVVLPENDYSFSLFEDAEDIIFKESGSEYSEWTETQNHGNGLFWTRTLANDSADIVLCVTRCCPECESTEIAMDHGDFDKLYCAKCGAVL